jgi:hypothetical protein
MNNRQKNYLYGTLRGVQHSALRLLLSCIFLLNGMVAASAIAGADVDKDSKALSVIDLTTTDKPVSIDDEFYLLPDETHQFSDEQIRSGKLDNRFSASNGKSKVREQWFKAHFIIKSNDENNVLFISERAMMLHNFRIWVNANGKEHF